MLSLLRGQRVASNRPCRAREAAVAAFARFLDGAAYSVEQIRFVNLIVDELTANGVMEPSGLFEPPYTDHAPRGPDYFFRDADVADIVTILGEVTDRLAPIGVA